MTTWPTRQLDPRDNSALVTTRPSWQLGPRDNSALVTTRPSWQLDPRDNSTLVTTRPSWQLDPRDNSTLVNAQIMNLNVSFCLVLTWMKKGFNEYFWRQARASRCALTFSDDTLCSRNAVYQNGTSRGWGDPEGYCDYKKGEVE